MRHLAALLVLLGIAFTTACVVEVPGPERHCSFWHPCR